MIRQLTTALLFSVLAGSVGSQSAFADQANLAARGQQLVLVCKGCHTLAKGEPHNIGPNLWNVVGRKVGAAAGFEYSEAFKQFEGSWTEDNLKHYLASPATFIPNNHMAFSGISSETDRSAVVAYLKTLTDDGPVVGASSSFDYGGLKEGVGREDVYTVCSRCHSIMLVKQQGMSRSRWTDTLVWMVEEQGMDELPADQHERILDYLAKYYGG
ncbi:cytochrome c [Amphritea atlantica]|uniref:Cytochrome c n=1 Tax=Amphritea atlantica TaxID=355243 RepID=A0A1H9IM96_9GAMM|nr:cytochrome c family protein [Amphritea atlantica]SEQ75723.1 cytochrome c [Amphritea atlantica]